MMVGKWFGYCAIALTFGLGAGSGAAYAQASQNVFPKNDQLAAVVRATVLTHQGLAGVDPDRARQVAIPAPRSQAGSLSLTRADLDALPKADGGAQWACLTEALYFEARGETPVGQVAVAEVILNRVKSGRFPNSVCAVVHQGTGRLHACQFSYRCDGLAETPSDGRAWEHVAKVARLSMDGVAASITDGATYYHTTAVKPRWSRKFRRTAQHGVHLFYRPS